MSNYYYVNSNVTESAGYYGAKQTGSWPTTNFESIGGAIGHSTPPVSGDYIIAAGDPVPHDNTTTLDIVVPDGVTVVCTASNACQTETTGASEQDISGVWGMYSANGGTVVVKGLTLTAEDDLEIGGGSAKIIYDNCNLSPGGNGTPSGLDSFVTASDGSTVEINNCIITMPDATAVEVFQVGIGAFITVCNSSFASNTNKPNTLLLPVGNGGVKLVISDSDFSNLSSGVQLLKGVSVTADDQCSVELISTKLPGSWSMGTIASPGSFVKVSNCNSGANRSISGYLDLYGAVLTDNTTHRDASDQVESQDVSLAVTTSASSKVGSPLRFLLASIRHDFSSQTYVDVEICHDDIGADTTNMQNDEIYLEIEVPNASDPGSTLKTNGPEAVLTYTASTHTTNSEAWTSPPTGDNTQTMTVDCGASGGEGWADIYVCVAKASITADELYVCPTVATRAS